MQHLIAYTGSLGVNAVNTDLTAAVDPEVSQRNGHYIFTEDYRLLAVGHFATSATRSNIVAPKWNAWTKFNIWPVNRNAAIPSNPQLDWWLQTTKPPVLPQNDEVQVQASNNLGAATEQTTVFLWLGPNQGWNQNLPAGIDPLKSGLNILECRINFTTAATVLNTWSALGAITFEQSLRGGSYALVGAQMQGTNLMAARFVFPRAPMYQNRRLRPGILATAAIGDVPMDVTPMQQFVWGELGRFSTFEPPQMEFWSNTSGAIAVEGRLWLIPISEDMYVRY